MAARQPVRAVPVCDDARVTAQTQGTHDQGLRLQPDDRRSWSRALRSPVVTGAVAAFWAAIVGLSVCVLVVLALWLLAEHGVSGSGDAVHAGVLTWLAANHATLVLSRRGRRPGAAGDSWSYPALALFRSGRWAGGAAAEALPAAAGATVVDGRRLRHRRGCHRRRRARSVAPPQRSAARCWARRCSRWSPAACGVLHGADLWGDAVRASARAGRPGAARRGRRVWPTLLGGGAVLLAGSLVWHGGSGRRPDPVARRRRRRRVGRAAGLPARRADRRGLGARRTRWVRVSRSGSAPPSPRPVSSVGAVPALPLLGGAAGHRARARGLARRPGRPAAGGAGRGAGSRLAGRPPGRARSPGARRGRRSSPESWPGVGLGVLAALSSGSLGAGPDVGPRAGRAARWRSPPAVEVGAIAALVAYEGCRHQEVARVRWSLAALRTARTGTGSVPRRGSVRAGPAATGTAGRPRLRHGHEPAGAAGRLRRPVVRSRGRRGRPRTGPARPRSTGPSRRGSPRSCCRSPTARTADAWDAALTEAVAEPPARPGGVGRLHEAGRPALPGPVRRPVRQHPPGAAAVVPRACTARATRWRTACR